MFFTWRTEDTNLPTFNSTQKKQIKTFNKFFMHKPDGFCCVWITVLYPEEQKYRKFSPDFVIPCNAWKHEPISHPNTPQLKMVCKTHWKKDESKISFPYDISW